MNFGGFKGYLALKTTAKKSPFANKKGRIKFTMTLKVQKQ
ncbi:hypothetical protein HPHPH28_1556 [Helicobacter pylori Hp H-28]|nr:hypothetical protein HPHPH28_1556 [Helicobacter pylori Hp H-28]